jgi:polar amino acid transport system substrate-binding protein
MYRFLSALLIFTFLVIGSSCSNSTTTWQRIEESGTLRVGLDPTYPPFESIDDSGLVGIDIDLVETVADDLNLQVNFSHFGYDGLYDALLTDQVDLLISAMAILPEKTRDFTYSQPYFDAGQILISETRDDVRGIEDIDSATIAVEIGSEGHVLANQLERSLATVIVKTFRSADEALVSVIDQKADVAIVDSITGRLFLTGAPELEYSSIPASSESYAIVVRSDDEDLLAHLNTSLDGIKQEGLLEQIIERWLDGS